MISGPITHVSHTVHKSTARHLNPSPDDGRSYTVNSWELWERCSYSQFLCCIHTYMNLCVCVCVCPARERECVSQQVQTANTLTCLTHSAPEPLTGALYCSWAGPAPKTSSRAAAAVRSPNQASIHLIRPAVYFQRH